MRCGTVGVAHPGQPPSLECCSQMFTCLYFKKKQTKPKKQKKTKKIKQEVESQDTMQWQALRRVKPLAEQRESNWVYKGTLKLTQSTCFVIFASCKRVQKRKKPGSCSKRTIIVDYLLLFSVDVVIQNWCGLAVLEEWISSISPIPLYGIDIYDYCVIQVTDLAYSIYLEVRICKTKGSHISQHIYVLYKYKHVWYVRVYVGSAFFIDSYEIMYVIS